MDNKLDNFVNAEDEQADKETTDQVGNVEDQGDTDDASLQSDQEQQQADKQQAQDTEAEPQGDDEQKTVPLAALHEARAEKRALTEKNEELERQLAERKTETDSRTASASEDAPKSLDPSDPDPYLAVNNDDYDSMMPSEHRELQQTHEAWRERESARQSQVVREEHYSQLENEAKQRFSAEAMGEHRDYESVTKTGAAWLTPQDRRAITNDPDPAKKLYELCVERCPYLSAKSSSTETPLLEKDKSETVSTKPEPSSINAPTLTKTFSQDDVLGNLAESVVGEAEEETG